MSRCVSSIHRSSLIGRAKNYLFSWCIHGEIPMGSERMEMRKRQMSVQQESAGGELHRPSRTSRARPTREAPTRVASAGAAAVAAPGMKTGMKGIGRHHMTSKKGPQTVKTARSPHWKSEENMLFWLACEEFSKETNKSMIEEKARLIYEDYISILSPKEVSLDSRVREVINRNMPEPTLHTFDDAQLQIYTLMQRDSYPRYLNSPAYKNLLNTLSEQSPES
ncbi:hypothetical protein CRENBAI_009690 [Crenichthys baileyi]|uniref:RGS domain-containing protein n=1 Tax=Crenichthys baileyi TaxID=28760 RepID=A0AAV9SEG5_9TELE